MSNNTPLERAILRTVVYYDVFDYPLTLAEIRRWLHPAPNEPVTATIDEIKGTAEKLVADGKLMKVEDYFVLPGRDGLAGIRFMRHDLGQRKWRIARSAARFLEIVPFVKMAAVVNTLAIDNAREESDVDLLIITAPEHIWIARFLVTGIVSMLGYRRHGQNIRNKICLSFYATTAGMNFDALRLKPADPHLTFWTAQAVPLIDDGTYQKFQAANSWVNESLPHAWDWEWKRKIMPPNQGLRGIKKFYELFFDSAVGKWMEMWLRDRQLSKMDKNLQSKAKLGGTDVIISEDVLKFHEDDRRERYRTAYQEKIAKHGL